MSGAARHAIREALAALGVERLLLGIHDPSFPGAPDEDIGRGSPSSSGGQRLIELAHRLGFHGLQLGPQGLTSEGNPSPYDGAQFSRDVLSIALRPLVDGDRWGGLVRDETLRAAIEQQPAGRVDRTRHRYVWRTQRRILGDAFGAFLNTRPSPLVHELAGFRATHQGWLERDALFDVLASIHGTDAWRSWNASSGAQPEEARLDHRLLCASGDEEQPAARPRAAIEAIHQPALDFHVFAQFLAHEQHQGFRRQAARLDLLLYGDLQVGFSMRDEWAAQDRILPGYRLGAPPSRTTPSGQPWGYPVLAPAADDATWSARGLAWLRARIEKTFGEFDGVRIDHPHGYVCPWVYRPGEAREGSAEAHDAVRAGARLFESPNLPDHPDLARYARVSPHDLNSSPGVARWADDWVVRLDEAQVATYGSAIDTMVEAARASGHDPLALVCEVLSTLPLPLERVLARHGLGRFRVAQKADPEDPTDLYLMTNAEPPDWVMLGNHDTSPIWSVVDQWRRGTRLDGWARYLSRRLAGDGDDRARLAQRIAAQPAFTVHALAADMLASRARHAMIFFTDLFGLRESYNVPGTVSDDNWSLRLTPDFERRYDSAAANGEALDLPWALALAIRARGADFAARHAPLVAALGSASRVPEPVRRRAEEGAEGGDA